MSDQHSPAPKGTGKSPPGKPFLRWTFIGVGWVLVVGAILLGPIPGPWSIPGAALGLLILLRYSPWARRTFRKAEKRHPEALGPVRNLVDDMQRKDGGSTTSGGEEGESGETEPRD